MVYAIIIISSIWVYFDARRIGARRGLIPGFFNLGPVAWMFACLLLWIVGFPAYLVMRSKIIEAAKGESGSISLPRVEQGGLNTAAKFVAIGWTLLFAVLLIGTLSELGNVVPTSDNEYAQAGFAIGATIGFGMYFVLWLVVAIPATIIYLITKRSAAPVVIVDHQARQTEPERTKKCPYCAERIKEDAVYCRFCNKDLGPAVLPPPPIEQKPERAKIDWLARARTHLIAGEFKEAVSACTMAIENQAGGDEHYLRAVAYAKMKDYKKMRVDLEEAVRLGHAKAIETMEKYNAIASQKATE